MNIFSSNQSYYDFAWDISTAVPRATLAVKRLEKDPPELLNVFTEIYKDQSISDALALQTQEETPLSGAIISIKDLFDIKGSVTRCGSIILSKKNAARTDAEAIFNLKQSGGIILGKTNMTELAYSGLGLNPHFGTPDNPIKKGHIPGGSTSGGAVSVATGLVDIAIGTDTGGSLRIPAAFTGLVGFKPTQNTISRRGCTPLSNSLDSIGPISNSVSACEVAWRTMANLPEVTQSTTSREKFQIIIPKNFGLTELDPEIASGFDALLSTLRKMNYRISIQDLNVMQEYKNLPIWYFSAVESRMNFSTQYDEMPQSFDPRVYNRMARADNISAVSYCSILHSRQRIIEAFLNEVRDAFLLLPTVAIMPPRLDILDDDDIFNAKNLLALRNTSLANVINGCSISIPFNHEDNVMGAMLTTSGGRDSELLKIAKLLEQDIQASQLTINR